MTSNNSREGATCNSNTPNQQTPEVADAPDNNQRRPPRTPRNGGNQVQLSNPKSYEGAISEINSILGLKHKKLDKKIQYQTFMDKAGN